MINLTNVRMPDVAVVVLANGAGDYHVSYTDDQTKETIEHIDNRKKVT